MDSPTSCQSCGSELPAAASRWCPECDRPQTAWQHKLDRHPHSMAVVKFLAGAVLIPLALWVVATIYSNRQDDRAEADRRRAELTAVVPQIRAARATLYDACVGSDRPGCAESLNRALATFDLTRAKLRDVVNRQLPALAPTALLLSSLDVAFDASEIWGLYFDCVSEGETQSECEALRRGYVMRELEIASYLIDYIECRVLTDLGAENDDPVPHFCGAVLEARERLAFEAPRRALATYDGVRFPREFQQVTDTIWCEALVPGMGLRGGDCR